MDPQKIPGFKNLQRRLAESFIHLLVMCPILRFVARIEWKIMEQRPDRLVAKTGIEGVDFLLGKKDRIGMEAGLRLRFNPGLKPAADMPPWPANPDIFSISNVRNFYGFQQRVQTRGDSPGAVLKFDVVIFLDYSERQSIRHDHNSLGLSWQMRDLRIRA